MQQTICSPDLLIQGLSSLQRKQFVNELTIYTATDIRRMLSRELEAVFSGQPFSLAHSHQVSIEFVASLFDCMMQDKVLAAPFKAKIARLQLPYCKLALIDDSLFEEQDHPARLLLNEMSHACIGWNYEDNQAQAALSLQIESIIERILREYTDSNELFEMLVHQFQVFQRQWQARIALIERRVCAAEQDKANAEVAHTAADSVIRKLLLHRILPDSIRTFLFECWFKVLYLTCLNHGQTSIVWNENVQLAQSLVNLAMDDIGYEKQVKIAQLLDSLELSAKLVQYDPYLLNQQLDVLRDALRAKPSFLELENATTRIMNPMSRVSRKSILLGAPMQPIPRSAAVISPLPRKLKIHESFVFQNCDELEFTTKAKKIETGRWLEFNLAEELEPVRCKLMTRITLVDKLVFVNNEGVKVLELTTPQMAWLLKYKQAQLLDSGDLFSRTLKNVIRLF